MKLIDLSIHHFGALESRDVGPFGDGLNVLFGPNEAGKTTLFRFVRGMLHGFGEAQRRDLVRGENGKNSPGSLRLNVDGTSTRFERFADGHGGRSESDPAMPALPAITESLAFFHPYETEATHALVDAAIAHGIDLHASAWPTADLDALSGTLDTRSREVTTSGSDSLKNLLRRHRELVAEFDESERSHRGRIEAFESQRSSLAARRHALVASLREARAERERLQAELADYERRREAESRERCRRTSERVGRIEERLRSLAEIDARIERLRDVVADLDTRAIELQRDVERSTAIGGPAGDATHAIRELEAEVERLAAHGRACRHCGGGHDTSCCDGVRSASETLRERVYRLCELVGRREVEARAIVAREELRELDGCRRGLRTQLAGLAERRTTVAASLESAGVFELLGRAPGTVDFCRCDRHRAHLDELRARLERLVREEDHAELVDDRRSDEHPHELRRRIEQIAERIVRDERLLAELESEAANEGPVDREFNPSPLRAAIAANRIAFARAAAERREIDRQRGLVAELRETQQIGRESTVITEASENLRRVTLGHNPRMRVSNGGRVEVLTTSRGWADHDALSAGTQHVVGLAFRLAVAGEMHRQGSHVPLLMDDVLVDNDLDRQKAAVELLAEYAGRGQQIVLLTCHLHLREACRSRGGQVVTFGGRETTTVETTASSVMVRPSAARLVPAKPRPPLPPSPNRPSPAARSERAESTEITESAVVRETSFDRSTSKSSERPIETASTASMSQESRYSLAEFTLHLGDSVRRLPQMTKRQTRLLGLAGVRSIGDLLELDWETHEALLVGHGIERTMVTRWRSEARLLATIPGLRAVEASALAEIGVRDAESLRALADGEITSRLERLNRTVVGRGLMQSGRRFDGDWLRDLRARSSRARALGDAGGGRSSRSRRNARRRRNGIGTGRPNRMGWANRTATGSDNERRNRERVERERLERERSERERSERERNDRLRVERERAEREQRPQTLRTSDRRESESTNGGDTGPRFYLHRASPVVDAPSIGPKTAERFKKIGVRTVDEFLNADPDETARRINKRHINADTIRQWQSQSKLVCRIPELRGHDAQILVACGIDDPETLAHCQPRELLDRVAPFCKTSAGKRIIRSGNAPDLDEVTAWIHWSRQSRALRAA